jgi:hypothetical protein
MIVPEGEERVLVCKELPSLIMHAEIIELVCKFEISKIELFSSACSDLKQETRPVRFDNFISGNSRLSSIQLQGIDLIRLPDMLLSKRRRYGITLG